MDPLKVRPKRDFVSVLMDERQVELASGLVLPVVTNAEKLTEGVGTIVRIGPGDKVQHLDLRPGDRVALRSYLKYANPIESDDEWPSGARKEYFLMSIDDIMAVVEPGTDIGVFSRPSQSAVESVDDEGKVRMR